MMDSDHAADRTAIETMRRDVVAMQAEAKEMLVRAKCVREGVPYRVKMGRDLQGDPTRTGPLAEAERALAHLTSPTQQSTRGDR